MSPRLFITGATGYIGGDVLYAVASKHPDYEITCLVRNEDKAALVAAAFPKIRFVYGTLDDADLLEKESKEADIVLNCANADHAGAVAAIVSGLAPHGGYLIHTSGAGILMYHDIAANVKPGTQLSDHVYDDLDGVAGVTSMPDGASHRDVDALVQNSFNLGVKPAIICPPTIYGETRGPAGGVSDQVPGLTRITLKKGKGITVNQGLAYWNHIHINDLGNLYLGLLEAAVDKNPKVEWNTNSYYFAESGEHIWKDVAHMLALEAHRQRLIDNGNAIESITAEEANSMEAKLGSLIGYNSRGRASRAREMFGWKPTGPALKDTLAETVKSEALKLGMKAGHAAKVSGE